MLQKTQAQNGIVIKDKELYLNLYKHMKDFLNPYGIFFLLTTTILQAFGNVLEKKKQFYS